MLGFAATVYRLQFQVFYALRNKLDSSVIQVTRYVLGLSWIYHGLFQKLVIIAPLENQHIATLGFEPEISELITKAGGIAEIVFGLAIIIFYKNRNLSLISIVSLVMFCVFVAVQISSLLIEAFNPVTTNLALIGLSYVLLKNTR